MYISRVRGIIMVSCKGKLSRAILIILALKKVGHNLPQPVTLTRMGIREGNEGAGELLRHGLGRIPATRRTNILSVLYLTCPWCLVVAFLRSYGDDYFIFVRTVDSYTR